jgi:hypothetical protein
MRMLYLMLVRLTGWMARSLVRQRRKMPCGWRRAGSSRGLRRQNPAPLLPPWPGCPATPGALTGVILQAVHALLAR